MGKDLAVVKLMYLPFESAVPLLSIYQWDMTNPHDVLSSFVHSWLKTGNNPNGHQKENGYTNCAILVKWNIS